MSNVEAMLERLCSQLNISVEETRMNSVNTAFYIHASDWDGIYLHPALKGKERAFFLAHEIGHAMLGAYDRYTPQEKRSEIEKQADVFASVLLSVLLLKNAKQASSLSRAQKQSAGEANSSRLRAIRASKKISQNELSRQSGVKQSVISDIESGKTSNPRVDTIIKLASVLGCTWDELLCAQEASQPLT